AQHLAPERLVRHIVDGHVRVHLPEPRIVRCEDDGLPTPVALRCEDNVIAIVRFTGEQHTGSRLRPTDAVEDGEWREPLPDCGGGIGARGESCYCMCSAVARWTDPDLLEVGSACRLRQRDRQ